MLRQITKNEQEAIISSTDKESFIASISGKDLQSERSAVDILADIFEITNLSNGNWDALFDRLQRDCWIRSNVIHLFIENARDMFETDEQSKRIFLEILSDVVEWWSGDVEKYVVDGKKKFFNVYLVD